MNKLRIIAPASRWFRFRSIQTLSLGINQNTAITFPAQQPTGFNRTFIVSQKHFSTDKEEKSDAALQESPLDSATYERVCAETLDSLCDLLEQLLENANLDGSDVAYSDGVLTVNLGKNYGTYVINRQTPNKQIWLSSPTSGPKRYDFVGPKTAETGRWIYKHNNESMHELLQQELKTIFKNEQFDFLTLPYGS